MSDAVFDMIPKYINPDGNEVEHDIDSIFEKTIDYLNSNKISYSKQTLHNLDISITFEGIKLIYHKKIDDSNKALYLSNISGFDPCLMKIVGVRCQGRLRRRVSEHNRNSHRVYACLYLG